MLEVFTETLIDNLKLFPFLFAAYLLLEYLEHKASEKTLRLVQNSQKEGPFIGAACGIIPQCGFSAAAANFYAARVITIGTLMAIFLSTSDEMVPIMLAKSLPLKTIIAIVGYKFLYGLICGLIIDFFIKNQKLQADISSLCRNENCPCEKADSLIYAAFFHAFGITVFIFAVSLVLNICMEFLPASISWAQILKTPLIGEFLSAFIGLIPNCSSSVILTQLYLENSINLSSLLSGTLVASGVGVLVLFRINRNLKDNLKILILLYVCGIFGGLISNLFPIY